MALYDNEYWLLSHIRNSFISTDDTGMCELVMVGEKKEVKAHVFSKEPDPDPEESEDDEDDDIGSYDIQMEMDFGMRERSNTAVRLEKLDHGRRKMTKMRHIKWETSMNDAESSEDLFVKKDVKQKQLKPKPGGKSGLTILMEQFTNLPLNPFMEFAKFDGSGQVNIPTRKYRIFLTMLPEEQRNYPLEICCIATAKIQDLIGLILLKFSTDHGDIPLKSVPNYGLYITEEDGEVDRDFPCLESRECVAKFGFTCLGLVEHKDGIKTVSFSETDCSPSSIEEGGGRKKTPSMSKAEETKQIRNDLLLMDVHNRAMEAPLYQSYKVFLVNIVRQRIEIHLGISGEKIEIDPVQQKSSKFALVKLKPVSHNMDTIAWCDITDQKSTRTTFRIVYNTGFGGSYVNRGEASYSRNSSSFPPTLQPSASFKHYDFETDKATTTEIVQKINLILDLRSSVSRKEYAAVKEKKHCNKKKAFLGK